MRKTTLIWIASVTLLAACSVYAVSMPAPTSTVAPTLTVPTRMPTATPLYLAKLGTVERDVKFCVVEGVSLTLDVYYPQEMSKPAPAVVYVHGGSWSSGNKGDSQGMADVPELLARGDLVVSVDYRHAPQYQFPAQIEDVKCAVRFLRANAARFNLNPNKIGAWGHSAGGHLVSLLGTTTADAGFEGDGQYLEQSSRVQAVVDMCGRADLRGMPLDKARSVFGVTDGSAHMLEHASPITFVSKDDPPFLILHGDKDDIVPPHASEEFYEWLKAAGVPVKLVVVKNADHSFRLVDGTMSPTRAELTKMIADFFDQYLK
jgi:acetyl esterase/lipase